MNLINLYSSLIQCIADQREAYGLEADEKRLAYHAALCLLADAELTPEQFSSMDEMVLGLVSENKMVGEDDQVLEFPNLPIANVFFLLSHNEDDSFPPDANEMDKLNSQIASLRGEYSQEYTDLASSILNQEKTEEELHQKYKKIDELLKN